MAKHIEKRFNKFYAVLDIPAGVRSHFGGKRRFFKAVNTGSETVAIGRAALLVGQWKRQINMARGLAVDPFEADVQWTRRVLAEIAGDQDPENADGVQSALIDKLQDMDEKHPGSGVAVWKRATGATIGTLDHLEEFLEVATDTDKGKAAKRLDVIRLAREFPTLDTITRPPVRRWCDGLIKNSHLKRTTVVRLLSSCRMYWRHLQVHALVPDEINPFDNLSLPGAKNGSAKADQPVPFEREEVVRVLRAAEAKDDQQLANVIKLAMWTGARIGEICLLKVKAVDLTGRSFKIEHAKTPAGWREVPIHADLQGTMERLCKESTDGYVITGLRANKYGERKGAVGQRFGVLKTALGFDNLHVFHSLRKTVITEMMRAGIRTETVRDIVGHEQRGVTARDYYGGATLEMKAKAIATLVYPAA